VESSPEKKSATTPAHIFITPSSSQPSRALHLPIIQMKRNRQFIGRMESPLSVSDVELPVIIEMEDITMTDASLWLEFPTTLEPNFASVENLFNGDSLMKMNRFKLKRRKCEK